MLLTILACLLIAAMALAALAVLLSPVYLAVQYWDAVRAPKRAAELAEIEAALRTS